MRLLAPFLSIAALAGCAGMPTIEEIRQNGSSGLIGCAPNEIVTSDHRELTWTAMCKGRVFQCSTGAVTACTERLK